MNGETLPAGNTPHTTHQAHAGEARSRAIGLPALLRGLGALVVAASLSAFLFQGWQDGNDLERYRMLLAQTVLLAVIGVASGRLLRETKGARTFLGLALVAVPVNFAILGALLYSQVRPAVAGLPGLVTWRAADLDGVLVTGALALPALALVSGFAFLVLTRRSAWRLGLLFLGLNGVLLLPSRDPLLIGWLLLASSGAALFGLHELARRDTGLRTLEGRFARAATLIAPAILAGRSLWLYDAGTFLLTAGALTLHLLLRQGALELPRESALRRLMEWSSLLPAAFSAWGIAVLADDLLRLTDALRIDLVVLLFAGLLFELSTRAARDGATLRGLAAVTAVGGLGLNLLAHGGAATAFPAVAVGVVVLSYGYTVRSRSLLVLGSLGALAGLVELVAETVALFHIGTWSGLTALGIVAIIAGSLIERHGPRLRGRLAEWRERLGEWQA